VVADELEIKKAAADFDVTVTAAMFTTTTHPGCGLSAGRDTANLSNGPPFRKHEAKPSLPALGNRRRLKIVVL
jgi:hypothetical protein